MSYLKTKCFGLLIISFLLIFVTCDPLVTQFEDLEDSIMYTSKNIKAPPITVDTVTVMTWNIRFGAGRVPWFGDSCGDRVMLTENEVLSSLEGIAVLLNQVKPDILLLQEIDVESKRTRYVDQVQWLLNHSHFNYATYASVWKAQWIPSDGLGRMNMGNAILSRWPIEEAVRIQLPLRGDQDELTKYFYLRRNILKAKILLPGLDNFYTVNVHTSAFSMDDTKQKQINIFTAELDNITADGGLFVAGGDLNTLPSGASFTNYCPGELCPDEKPEDQEGCDYSLETTWLNQLYSTYTPAIALDKYLSDEEKYFTHTPDWTGFWDRKLDYLFTNHKWILNSASTHQETTALSDHAPVSVKWEVPK